MATLLEIGQQDRPSKFSLIELEQLAAQAVAVLDAHFKRPDADEKQAILKAASQQVDAMRLL